MGPAVVVGLFILQFKRIENRRVCGEKEKCMSKEKNLTVKNSIGDIVTVGDSAYGYATGLPRTVSGPAIDRLHEFEKLGMEPEEIMHIKRDRDIINRMYVRTCKDLEIFERANTRLKHNIRELQEQNKFLEEPIDAFNVDELKEKIDEKDRYIESLEAEVDDLRDSHLLLENLRQMLKMISEVKEIKLMPITKEDE